MNRSCIGQFLLKENPICPSRDSRVRADRVLIRIVKHFIRRREENESFLEIGEDFTKSALSRELISFEEFKILSLFHHCVHVFLALRFNAVVEITHPENVVESLEKIFVGILVIFREIQTS